MDVTTDELASAFIMVMLGFLALIPFAIYKQSQEQKSADDKDKRDEDQSKV